MFKKLCGDEGLASVVLVTTMWNKVEEASRLKREEQLIIKKELWEGMIVKGSKVFRHDNGIKSAMKIATYLISRKYPVVLDIQRQMVDKHMTLD